MNERQPGVSSNRPNARARHRTMVCETNYACNLRCVHCYVPPERKDDHTYIAPTLAESLFEQSRSCGFEAILLTGGEPLCHPQFDRLYDAAWDLGLRVSLFTNALQLTDGLVRLFERKPPQEIRVSVFGGTRASYAAVTGRDAFDIAVTNVERLARLGLPVHVKVPLLRQTMGDAAAIRARLQALGVPCKIEIRVVPGFDGNLRGLSWRLTPEEIVKQDLEDASRNLVKFRELQRQSPRAPRTLRHCLDHCQPFVITPPGHLQLCFFIRDAHVDLTDARLDTAIRHLTDIVRGDPDVDRSECGGCAVSHFCTYCPGWARAERGRAGARIPFLCETAALFYQKYLAADRRASPSGEDIPT